MPRSLLSKKLHMLLYNLLHNLACNSYRMLRYTLFYTLWYKCRRMYLHKQHRNHAGNYFHNHYYML